MKTILFFVAIATSLAMFFAFKKPSKNNVPMTEKSIHDFVVKDLSGKDFNFNDLKGKKILIVNTASKCGYTPQYEGLEKLYKTYKDKNFVVIGFPCNQFGGQEPGDSKTIATFCQTKFGVTFPMMAKIKVKGKQQAPIYQFLTQKQNNGVLDARVSWNFNKFLVDENGKVIKHLKSSIKPFDEKITNWIEGHTH